MEKVRVEFIDGFEVEAEVNGDCYIVDEAFALLISCPLHRTAFR